MPKTATAVIKGMPRASTASTTTSTTATPNTTTTTTTTTTFENVSFGNHKVGRLELQKKRLVYYSYSEDNTTSNKTTNNNNKTTRVVVLSWKSIQQYKIEKATSPKHRLKIVDTNNTVFLFQMQSRADLVAVKNAISLYLYLVQPLQDDSSTSFSSSMYVNADVDATGMNTVDGSEATSLSSSTSTPTMAEDTTATTIAVNRKSKSSSSSDKDMKKKLKFLPDRPPPPPPHKEARNPPPSTTTTKSSATRTSATTQETCQQERTTIPAYSYSVEQHVFDSPKMTTSDDVTLPGAVRQHGIHYRGNDDDDDNDNDVGDLENQSNDTQQQQPQEELLVQASLVNDDDDNNDKPVIQAKAITLTDVFEIQGVKCLFGTMVCGFFVILMALVVALVIVARSTSSTSDNTSTIITTYTPAPTPISQMIMTMEPTLVVGQEPPEDFESSSFPFGGAENDNNNASVPSMYEDTGDANATGLFDMSMPVTSSNDTGFVAESIPETGDMPEMDETYRPFMPPNTTTTTTTTTEGESEGQPVHKDTEDTGNDNPEDNSRSLILMLVILLVLVAVTMMASIPLFFIYMKRKLVLKQQGQRQQQKQQIATS